MKASSAKAKGRALQNWFAEKLSILTGLPWGYDEVIAPREMGQSGTDIRLVSVALERIPWSIECKNCEKWVMHKWIKQAKDNLGEGTNWLLLCKRNRQKPVVVIDAEVFLELLASIPGEKKGV